MQPKVNNRYREYTIALPALVAEQIGQRAREQGVSEAVVIKQLIAKAMVMADAPEEEAA